MTTLRWALRIHKWIALIVGLQILLWIMGGVVMSAIPIEHVRGEHKIREPAPVTLTPSSVITIAEAAKAANMLTLGHAELGQLQETPVWRLRDADGNRSLVNAVSGQVLSPLPEQLARSIATTDYLGDAPIRSAQYLATSPTEYGRPAPVWKIAFDDNGNTTLYIDPFTAEVRARRSSTWRFYDFFWRLHVMDYNDGEDFNHPLLITAAGAALLVAMSGITLLFLRMRRLLTGSRRRRSPTPS